MLFTATPCCCLCLGNSVVKRVGGKAEVLQNGPIPGRKKTFCSSSLLTFWLVRRPLLLVRRGAAGGDLLLLYLYGA